MGWKPEEGYYDKHVKQEGFSNKITREQEGFNKLKLDETREGISIVSTQLAMEKGILTHEEVEEQLEQKEDNRQDFSELLGYNDDEIDR